MLIKMLETRDGSPNGIKVATYTEGETYDVPGELAEIFLESQAAEPANGVTPPAEPDDGQEADPAEVVIDTGEWDLAEAEKRLPGHKLLFVHGDVRVFIADGESGLATLKAAALKNIAGALGLDTSGTRTKLIKAITEAITETK